MRFATLLTAAALAASGSAAPWNGLVGGGNRGGSDARNTILHLLGIDLTVENHYGALVEDGYPGAYPGWYFGDRPERQRRPSCLVGFVCTILRLFPDFAIQCPERPPRNPPPSPGDGYTQLPDFGIVETVADCKAMCNSVGNCVFANTYHDVNGKDGSPLLTCSLYSACQTAATATNTGGQTQPNGSINYITDSDGWCKQ